MNKDIFRRALPVFVLCAAAHAQAGGNTNWAVPTQIDVVTAVVPGIMVHGAFGNAGGCTQSDVFFIPKAGNEQQFAQMYAALLAANAAGTQVSAYISTCAPQNWYALPSVTFGNLVGTMLSVRN